MSMTATFVQIDEAELAKLEADPSVRGSALPRRIPRPACPPPFPRKRRTGYGPLDLS